MMCDSKYLKIFNSKIGYLNNQIERDLVTEIEYYIEKNNKINLADFLTYIENYDNLKEFANNICGSVNIEELNEEIFLDYIKALDELLKKENLKIIKEKIYNGNDINEQLENIEKQIAMKKKIIEIEEV